MTGILKLVKPGVVTGGDVQKLLQAAKQSGFALPAVNVVNTNSVNAVLEAAAAVSSPVMIQFSVLAEQGFSPAKDAQPATQW